MRVEGVRRKQVFLCGWGREFDYVDRWKFWVMEVKCVSKLGVFFVYRQVEG